MIPAVDRFMNHTSLYDLLHDRRVEQTSPHHLNPHSFSEDPTYEKIIFVKKKNHMKRIF